MARKGQVIVNPRTGQRMVFLLTSQDTQGELLQIDCTNPPTGVKEPEHIHPYQENRFTLLSGSLMFSVNGKEQQARAGETISIPPGAPHFFWNGGPEEAHYLQEFRPALRIEFFFETLFRLAQEGKLNEQGRPGMLQTAAVIPEFWNEIQVTQPPAWVQRVFFGLLRPVSRVLGYRGAA